MITKEVAYDLVSVDEDGVVSARQVTRLVEDGTILNTSFHRSTYAPGDDLTEAPEPVKKIASVFWTQDVIDKYAAKIEAALPRTEGA